VLCVDNRNEVKVGLAKSVYSMKTIVEISQFKNARLQVRTFEENGHQREKKGEREMEKRVRYSVHLERVMVSLIKLTVGQIPRSSMTYNPLETNRS
jgi:hypothetical protein